jgi:hypothetical protein
MLRNGHCVKVELLCGLCEESLVLYRRAAEGWNNGSVRWVKLGGGG